MSSTGQVEHRGRLPVQICLPNGTSKRLLTRHAHDQVGAFGTDTVARAQDLGVTRQYPAMDSHNPACNRVYLRRFGLMKGAGVDSDFATQLPCFQGAPRPMKIKFTRQPDCTPAIRDSPGRTSTTPSRADVDHQVWSLSS